MIQPAPPTNRPDEFIRRLIDCGVFPLQASGIDILQMNITRQCNLTCKHCHVQAGPQRKEAMSRETMMECIKVAGRPEITTMDITGGAPEMHPDLEWLIGELAALNKRLIVRSNLVVMLEPAYRHYIDVFAANNVELVGSLPDYNAQKADRQRGAGTFELVIEAIRALNQRSFGVPGSGLVLHLVHNPVGAYLPGPQHALEAEYRRVLRDEHNLEFNTLFCLVNSPIGRDAFQTLDERHWTTKTGAANSAMRVIGVAENGDAHAYSVGKLRYHETANTTLGSRAIVAGY